MIHTETVSKDLQQLREQAPLVHSITNYVVMNPTANALLSIGASPVMAHEVDEMEEMVAIAGALVINIGTLSRRWIEAMHVAGKKARELGKPIVLDPVGAGATSLRTETAHALIHEAKPAIIRGNASEIMALVKKEVKTKGVDSTTLSDDAVEAAKHLASDTGSIISISGKTDYITDGQHTVAVENGHHLMGRITGTGCTASALTGAFAAVASPMQAAADAMITLGIAGEKAAEKADAPGSFQTELLDALYRIDHKLITQKMRLH